MRRFLIVAATTFCVGCGREIGDDCSTNSDCGSGRICDLSQPGGYCTISPCREDTCPPEALCIIFTHEDSYCMRKCQTDDECRAGYKCVTSFRDYAGFCNASAPQ